MRKYTPPYLSVGYWIDAHPDKLKDLAADRLFEMKGKRKRKSTMKMQESDVTLADLQADVVPGILKPIA
jgi:hypothetical protein